jgi:hypothetical protein
MSSSTLLEIVMQAPRLRRTCALAQAKSRIETVAIDFLRMITERRAPLPQGAAPGERDPS